MKDERSWHLTAWVDGQLGAKDAAEVAASVARSPLLAEEAERTRRSLDYARGALRVREAFAADRQPPPAADSTDPIHQADVIRYLAEREAPPRGTPRPPRRRVALWSGAVAALIGLFAIALVVAESVGPKVVAPPLVVAIPIATEATDLAAQARVAEPEARAPTPPDGAAPSTHDRGAAPEVSRHTLALVVVVEPREATVTSDLGRLERVSAGVYALYDVDESRPVALTARAPRHEPLTREVTIGSDIAIETLELVSSEPPPKPTPATGTLRVHARPWAQVTIDGRPHGTTPRDIALPAGRHTVQLCKAAECHTKVVVVPARGSVEVDHSFGAQPSPF